MQVQANPAQDACEAAPRAAQNLSRRLRNSDSTWIDFLVAALAMAAFVLWIYRFRYRGLFAEDDLYRLLVGLLDGARSGARQCRAGA